MIMELKRRLLVIVLALGLLGTVTGQGNVSACNEYVEASFSIIIHTLHYLTACDAV